MAATDTLVSQGAGYGLIAGFGALFAIIILVAVRIQKKYLLEDSQRSEMFMVANRSVGTGLTCSAVFSSWMWINETVFSAVFCYDYGIAAPVWFGSGLSFQIALMAVIGITAKLRVPHAHTSLEIVRKRYGNVGHIVFTVFNLINNVFGCSCMVLVGAQLVTGITGMHIVAATILLPLGVVLYTAVGGLKATFLTDFLHTSIALILIIYFTLAVLTNEHIGGLHGLYDKIQAADKLQYIDGNYLGSLLSFKSKGAIMFGLVLKLGNLALVVMDTAFWQKSFASEVRSTVPAYDLASLAIFAVPWGLGTVIGLTGRAIEQTPLFISYPNGFTAAEVNGGLVMPYVLKSLLGTGACIGLLLLLFMAVTSTVSSSMIAVSSIISFDFYRTYFNPKATDRQTLKVSHWAVVFHGCFIAAWTIMLNYAGANGTWITYFIPVLTCPVLGLATGLGIWLGLSQKWYGTVSIATTTEQAPSLYGSLASLFSPALFSVIISCFYPEKFDWREFLRIDLIQDKSTASSPQSLSVTELDGSRTEKDFSAIEASSDLPVSANPLADATGERTPLNDVVHPFDEPTIRYMHKWLRIASTFLVVNILITFVAWPMPLYRDYVFTKSFFSGWVTVAIFWQFFALFAVVLYPIYDGRFEIAKAVRGIRKDWIK